METVTSLLLAATSTRAPVTRAQRVQEMITRLDDCAARLEYYRDTLGEDLYADLVSQAYAYAQFLSDCRLSGLNPADPRLSEITKELIQFCDFLEEEMPL